jgi:hypothetical protein
VIWSEDVVYLRHRIANEYCFQLLTASCLSGNNLFPTCPALAITRRSDGLLGHNMAAVCQCLISFDDRVGGEWLACYDHACERLACSHVGEDWSTAKRPRDLYLRRGLGEATPEPDECEHEREMNDLHLDVLLLESVLPGLSFCPR